MGKEKSFDVAFKVTCPGANPQNSIQPVEAIVYNYDGLALVTCPFIGTARETFALCFNTKGSERLNCKHLEIVARYRIEERDSFNSQNLDQ